MWLEVQQLPVLLKWSAEQRGIYYLVTVALPSPVLNHDEIVLQVFPDRILSQMHTWYFPGGQAEICQPSGPLWTVPLSDPSAFKVAMGKVGMEALGSTARRWEALVTGGALWQPEVWKSAVFRLFRRQQVDSSASSDQNPGYFELRDPAADGLGDVALRLGPTVDCIVTYERADQTWRARLVQELDAGTPSGLGRIQEVFGEHVAVVAASFAMDRAGHFVDLDA